MNLIRNIVIDILGRRKTRRGAVQPYPPLLLPIQAGIVIWQPDGKLGDAVIISLLIHNIKRNRPDIRIVVITRPGASGYWSLTDCVDRIISIDRASDAPRFRFQNIYRYWRNFFALSNGESKFDLFISFDSSESLETLIALYLLKPKQAIGFGVEMFGAFSHSIADHLLSLPYQHVSSRIKSLLEILNMNFSVCCPLVEQAAPGGENNRKCFFNTYGAGQDRTLSFDTILWIIEQLGATNLFDYIEVSLDPRVRNSFELRAEINSMPNNVNIVYGYPDTASFINSIRNCGVVVTTDTAAGHLGALFNASIIVFFSDQQYKPNVWHPISSSLLIVLPSRNGFIDSFDKSRTKALIFNFLKDRNKMNEAP